MRISDWSSDVCSSDLIELAREQVGGECQAPGVGGHEGTRAQLDVAVGHPVDRAQIVVHHFALPAAVPHQRLEKRLAGNEAEAIDCLETIPARVRTEERRVGKEWVTTGCAWWSR